MGLVYRRPPPFALRAHIAAHISLTKYTHLTPYLSRPFLKAMPPTQLIIKAIWSSSKIGEHTSAGVSSSVMVCWHRVSCSYCTSVVSLNPGKGGGILRLEKGTDCGGPTAAELWLSRAKIVKMRGCGCHYECA